MSLVKELYRAEQLPVLQNRMFSSPEAAQNCVKGDVVLVQDLQTGLIFNKAFRPELMHYDADYQNEQAVSPMFRTHLKDVSEIIRKHFQGLKLIEVGCGKGHFLETLQRMGFEISGVDPAYEGTNTRVFKTHFSPELGLSADAIILRHVLEHVQDPVGFLSGLCESNGGSGKIYIEVPCFDWTCQRRAWFDIFYEHVNYFRLGDFSRIFGRVYQSGHTFGGQYLYVVADLSTVREAVCDNSAYLEFPQDFLHTVNGYAARLIAQRRAHRQAAIWGGASKGVIFALFMQRAGAGVELLVDVNPAKQGNYLAATGLRVATPRDALLQLAPGSDVFVMNSNYLDEIDWTTEGKFNLIAVDSRPVPKPSITGI